MNKPAQANGRSAALVALSADQRKQLAAYAQMMSQGTGNEGQDLLQDAFARWLSSDKPVEGPEETGKFLRGAISSIRFNTFRREKVVRRYEGVRAVADEDEEDPLDQAADPAASTEGPLFVQQVYDLCGDDEEVQFVVDGPGGQRHSRRDSGRTGMGREKVQSRPEEEETIGDQMDA